MLRINCVHSTSELAGCRFSLCLFLVLLPPLGCLLRQGLDTKNLTQPKTNSDKTKSDVMFPEYEKDKFNRDRMCCDGGGGHKMDSLMGPQTSRTEWSRSPHLLTGTSHPIQNQERYIVIVLLLLEEGKGIPFWPLPHMGSKLALPPSGFMALQELSLSSSSDKSQFLSQGGEPCPHRSCVQMSSPTGKDALKSV